MKPCVLKGIAPDPVFGWFEKICSVPHGSGNTDKIADLLEAFAKENGLRYVRDEMNNMILFGDATAGYEDHAPVILQGHMDMVCEKAPDCVLDMEKDGLDVTSDGKFVFARGTSLGGDDGIAVAMILALLEDRSIPHPPLEAVITADEEIGMLGAEGCDLSPLKGRRMINIDSEEEGVFTVGCAGGVLGRISLPVSRRAVYGPCIELTVEGLHGGHSGTEIHNRYANAHKVMGELLSRVQKLMPLCLTAITGGTKDNVIPNACTAKLVAMGIGLERINEITDTLQKEIREKYDEPNAVIRGDDVDALGGNALTTEDTSKVIALLNAAPNGVQGWNKDIPGMVQTSLNMGGISLTDELELSFCLRSDVEREKREMGKKLEELATFYGGTYSECGDYAAWQYRKNSPLRELMASVYKEQTGKEPTILTIHGGLECGVLGKKLPDIDCISIGPDVLHIHSCRERLDIASTGRTWEFLLAVLKKL